MKHFNKICYICFQFDYPNTDHDFLYRHMVDPEYPTSDGIMHKIIYSKFLKLVNQNDPKGKMGLNDVSNGFDVGDVRIQISSTKTEKQMEKIVEFVQKQLNSAYEFALKYEKEHPLSELESKN